jgi:nucleoside-diphosphate-sugar epimerase
MASSDVDHRAAPRALVTGGSGYFGSLLLKQLLRAGWSCASLDLHDAQDRPPEVDFHRADVRDADAVARAVAGCEVVFHNVAQVPLAKDRQAFESVNVHGTRVLLEAAQGAGVSKVVYTSSSAVFGVPERNPVTETTTPVPREAYGRAKLEGEKVCDEFVRRGLDVTVIRPRTILGHGRLGIFQILFEWVRQGHNIPVLGSGDNLYQFVHADDLADATLRAACRPGPAVYHCGAREFGTMRQTLEALCRHAATGSRVRSVPARPAQWAMELTSVLGLSPLGAYHSLMFGRSMYFDIGRAVRELGWEPRHSNEDMIVQSYDWYLQHRQEILAAGPRSRHRSAVSQGVLALVKRLL